MPENPFRAALGVLEQDGWSDRIRHDAKDGTHCVVGALEVALWPERDWLGRDMFAALGYDTPEAGLVAAVAYAQFPERFDSGWPQPDIFNDHPDTTFDDVRLVLEKAAVRWEETHG